MRLNSSASPLDVGILAFARAWLPTGIASCVLALTACSVEPSATSPLSFNVHCGDEDGDTTCAQLAIGKPFCDLCRPASSDQGCAPEPPTVPACRVGGGLATSGSDSDESSGTSTEGTTTIDTLGTDTTMAVDESSGEVSSSSSGGPMLPCESPDGTFDDGCEEADSARPYCVAQTCVSCETAGGSDFCGAAGDPLLPACSADSGQCSPCGDVDTFACGQELPVCDATGACLACAAHGECATGACHLDPADPLAGQCFAEDEVVYVDTNAVCPGDGSEDTPNCSLADALSSLAEGQNRLLRVAPGAYDESAALVVDATVAILGNGGVPSIEAMVGAGPA